MLTKNKIVTLQRQTADGSLFSFLFPNANGEIITLQYFDTE